MPDAIPSPLQGTRRVVVRVIGRGEDLGKRIVNIAPAVGPVDWLVNTRAGADRVLELAFATTEPDDVVVGRLRRLGRGVVWSLHTPVG